jgi:ABC-type sugar transport system substrate-binding protein
MQLTGRWRGAAALAVCALVFTGCGRGGSSSEGSGSGTDITIGAVSGSAANPAVQMMNDAMKARAKEKGVKLLTETSESVEEQIEKAEAMIAQGVTYLGLHPWDGAAVVPLIESASARGVKVVILIDGVPDVVENGKALTFISGNETAAAQEIGKWVAGKYPGSPQAAVITGTPGNLSADNRTNGFKAGIKGSAVKVVAEGTGNWARDEALRVAGDMLTANPGLNVVFANNDEMAFGALKAITESGRADKIDTIGWNGTCIGLKALLDGDFALEAVLPFDVFGAGLIDAALDDSGGKQVPKTITPEVPLLTTDQAKAILDGKQQASGVLLARLKEASSGSCK